jgi:hypothetical protein
MGYEKVISTTKKMSNTYENMIVTRLHNFLLIYLSLSDPSYWQCCDAQITLLYGNVAILLRMFFYRQNDNGR